MISNSKKCSNVLISPLVKEVVEKLIKNIHFSETLTKFFTRPLYCRALINITIEDSDKHQEAAGGDDTSEHIIAEVRSAEKVKMKNKSRGDNYKMNSNADTDEFVWEDDENTSTTTPTVDKSKFFKYSNEDETTDNDFNTNK